MGGFDYARKGKIAKYLRLIDKLKAKICDDCAEGVPFVPGSSGPDYSTHEKTDAETGEAYIEPCLAYIHETSE